MLANKYRIIAIGRIKSMLVDFAIRLSKVKLAIIIQIEKKYLDWARHSLTVINVIPRRNVGHDFIWNH